MPATRFVAVSPLAAVPPGASRAVEVEGRSIALFNVGGSVYAIENICPHAGGPLADGARDGPCGEVVECSWHGWRFDVRTGESPDLIGERVPAFPTRIADGMIEVGLDGGARDG